MAFKILHDEKVLEKILNDELSDNTLAIVDRKTGIELTDHYKQNCGENSILRNQIYDSMRAYSDKMFSENFKGIQLSMKLSNIESDDDLITLYAFRENLNQLITRIEYLAVNEFLLTLKQSIEEHFNSISVNKLKEIGIIVSNMIINDLENSEQFITEASTRIGKDVINNLTQPTD